MNNCTQMGIQGITGSRRRCRSGCSRGGHYVATASASPQGGCCSKLSATAGLLQPALRGGRYGQHSTTAEAIQAALYSGVAAITISNQSSN